MHAIRILKQLNKQVTYQHFKIESLSDVCKFIQPNYWLVKAHLKDAKESKKALYHTYLQTSKASQISRHTKWIFQRNAGIYKNAEITISNIPKAKILHLSYLLLTHICKEVLKCNIPGKRKLINPCQSSVMDELTSLGFTTHTENWTLEPTQCIEFLGFAMKSVDIT